MTVRKTILWTLALPLLLALIFSIMVTFQNVIIFLLTGIGLWIIGLVLGVLLSAAFKSPQKEPWLYITAQVTIFVGFTIILAVMNITEARAEKKTRNIKHNHLVVDLDSSYQVISQDHEFIRTAFKKLESTFSNPNNFRLHSYFTKTKDTVLSTYTETVYSVYFAYSTEENDHLFSKISVLENKAYIDILNGDTETNQEYRKLRAKQDQDDQKGLKSAMDAIRELPDSTKKQLRDAIDPD